jgi:predicted nucleotide-binding protein
MGFAGYPELGHGSRGNWREFDPEEVKSAIYQLAGSPDLAPARAASADAARVFDESKAEVVSVLELELSQASDPFLSRLKGDLEKLEPMSRSDFVRQLSPKGYVITRDMLALGQGNQVPPHIRVAAEVLSIQQSFGICEVAADICVKAASHLERKSRKKVAADRIGTNVFIGHGRSLAWREVKDFVQDRLRLPWDEFNRVPVAGVTNIARLSEMLDAAAIALLVLTAEDELADGDIQARMNVVHEAGLFQGRLGFTKAIVLLEDGCKEFTNIQGLGQIRFPKGQVSSKFEELRRVLEREGLIEA